MITVIVPVYNVQKYLSKCIDSIINQTYRDLEIILVNDGSTDISGEICDKYKLKDDRIRVIHKKNGGLSEARNAGLDVAKGDYIAFLDSDDWVDKELYDTLYKLSTKYNSDISICNFKYCHNEEEKLNNSYKEIVYSNIDAMKQIYDKNYIQIIVAWNKLYKREIFNDLRYPKGKIHEDEFLTPIILYKANKISYIEKELIYYRQTPNSIMNREFNITRLDYLEALDNRINFFKSNNLNYLYKQTVATKVSILIKFYYKVKESNIDNKFQVMEKLNNDLAKMKYDYINMYSKNKIQILIFKFSPELYKVLVYFFSQIRRIK
ncbi:glycosyltransferase family 2 protein [Clostridium carnis]